MTPGGDCQLAECGLAKILEDAAAPGERTMPPGALRYTAPELFGENRALARRTPRADVYAFGCVLFEARPTSLFCVVLTGAQVFAGAPPFADVPEGRVPRALYDGQALVRPAPGAGLGMGDELWALVQRCTAFDLSRRPTMAQAVTQLTAARHADESAAMAGN